MTGWLWTLVEQHPAVAFIGALASVLVAVAALLEARSRATDADALRRDLGDLRERVARLEGRQ